VARGRRSLRGVVEGEVIGLRVKVTESTDPGLKGRRGVVVDETMKTLLVQEDSGRRIRVAKATAVFEFSLEDEEPTEVEGRLLVARPEDRTKEAERLLRRGGGSSMGSPQGRSHSA